MDSKVMATRLQHAEFDVEAVLFDMDGTLTDSIGAVEAAWGSVADELGMDPQEVIDATHGKRAIDNLRSLKPHLQKVPDDDMDPHVEEFEKKILDNADQYQKEVRSRRESVAESIRSSRSNSRRASRSGSRSDSQAGSRSSSPGPNSNGRRSSSFAAEVTRKLKFTNLSAQDQQQQEDSAIDDAKSEKSVEYDEDPFDDEEIDIDSIQVDTSDLVDNSVRILPGVRRMIDSIPKGRYAVATSGAKTYCHGCLKRVGIQPPEITITADDKRLENGKPFPDPFILAAKCLGYDVKKCLVVEDSPSGIRAGVASGARTIAVATSHPFEKIKDSGAHFFVPTLDYVRVKVKPDGRLRILIDKKYGDEVAEETAAESAKLKATEGVAKDQDVAKQQESAQASS